MIDTNFGGFKIFKIQIDYLTILNTIENDVLIIKLTLLSYQTRLLFAEWVTYD